jgi:hypothetical protein
MNKKHTITAATALTFLICQEYTFATDKFSGIEQMMDKSRFEAAGLDTLTPEQLQVLNDWLLEYTANEAPVVRRKSEKVKKTIAETIIKTQISGSFTGWDGKTVFELANGQRWQQRTRGRYKAALNAPAVSIERNALGMYRMTVDESGRSVGVKRLN